MKAKSENRVKNIQAASYNGVHTVYCDIVVDMIFIKSLFCIFYNPNLPPTIDAYFYRLSEAHLDC